MLPPILATKLSLPLPKARTVYRARLLDRLDAGLSGRLTLVSAPAGSGKTVLLADWLHRRNHRAVWLSLDGGMGDVTVFLSYLIQGLQTVVPDVGAGLLEGLRSPFPPQPQAAMEALINELATKGERLVVVLDDYHRIDNLAVDGLVGSFLEHGPRQVPLVVATREDPSIPLGRLRAGGELAEFRMVDLRFREDEARQFYREAMGLGLEDDQVRLLESRTEGWATGLQLAALSLAGHEDPQQFVRSFAGSHRFVLDYLIEEVLQGLPDETVTFLLSTSVLDTLCADLCDAVVGRTGSGQVLADLEQANLFLVPLDGHREWYRYHHLFADMLAQRRPGAVDAGTLHRRASDWYAAQGLGAEAFRHARAALDQDRAAGVVEGGLIPGHDRVAVSQVLGWLGGLPGPFLDGHPVLRLRQATMALFAGQTAGVEEAALAAERALDAADLPQRNDLLGQAATARATVAVTRYEAGLVAEHARRALALLDPANLPYRFTALSALGFGQLLSGDRVGAREAHQSALALAQKSGDRFSLAMALTNLGQMRELGNDLAGASQAYRDVIDLMGPHPQPYACEASLGLARIGYEANDLDTAQLWCQEALALARQYDPAIDRFVLVELLQARIFLARREWALAANQLEQTARALRDRGFHHRWTEWSAVQVDLLLAQGQVTAAVAEAEAHPSPWTAIRVGLALRRPGTLEATRTLVADSEARGWVDDALRARLLEAMALVQTGDSETARDLVTRGRQTSDPGFVRFFLEVEHLMDPGPGLLSHRELEVLQLVADGLSNEAIGERLFVALDTVKGHNRRIFEKLQVSRRTEAVAAARRLGLLGR